VDNKAVKEMRKLMVIIVAKIIIGDVITTSHAITTKGIKMENPNQLQTKTRIRTRTRTRRNRIVNITMIDHQMRTL